MVQREDQSSFGTRRLVLGFDAGCAECAALAGRIEDRVGERLTIRDLKDPEVLAWRKESLGEDATWAPTLFEIRDNTVRAWTGWRMGWILSRKFGAVNTWRIIRALGEVGAAPRSEVSPFAEVLTRGQFLKGVGGAALATSVLTAGVGFVPGAYAAERGTRVAAQAEQTRREVARMSRAISLMEQHMRTNKDGTLALDEKGLTSDIRGGAAKDIEQEVFDELKESLEAVNLQIRRGELKAREVFPSEDSAFVYNDASELSTHGCRGKSGRRIYWWGLRLYLNSCNVNTLRLAFAGYLSLAQLCNKFPFTTVPCRVVGAILSMSWAYIEYVNKRGGNDGLVFQKSWASYLPKVYSQ